MALLEQNHPAVSQSPRQFWEDELKNCWIMLSDINRRIHELEIESYTLDTGQSSQSVKRSSLDSLFNTRKNLLSQIKEIEAELGVNTPSRLLTQVVPF